ncbi:MAG TPA: phosphoglycerate mutase family protein [Candidatus Limnocylindrales bacterium]|nr:phosphoglycerate mutase family protein [Candidatus Limnocylindrales bacterium]
MTTLALLRHAHAGDPGRWTGPDATRPLSDKGRRQAERLGRHLRAVGDGSDVLIASPKVRALQTAEIVGGLLEIPVVTDDRLGGPLDLDAVEAILVDAGNPARPILVGHDPDFSDLLGALLGVGAVAMRKGAFARVEIGRPIAYGRGELRALLPPDLLADG